MLKKTDSRVMVLFIANCSPYRAGERAAFNPRDATKLVDRKVAVLEEDAKKEEPEVADWPEGDELDNTGNESENEGGEGNEDGEPADDDGGSDADEEKPAKPARKATGKRKRNRVKG